MIKRSGKIGLSAVNGVPEHVQEDVLNMPYLCIDRGDLANIGQTYPGLSITTHSAKFSPYYQRKYFELTLYGITKSKKNSYSPRKGGMYRGTDLKAELDELEKQVPGELRDLNLEHPDMFFKFKSRSAKRDRDGLLSTILDVLVTCKVITDDRIARCNGTITLAPAEVCDEDSVYIMIYPR